MKTNYIQITIFSLTAMLFSCSTNDLMTYQGDSYIQFGPDPSLAGKTSKLYQTSFNYDDTLRTYTFVYEPAEVTQDTVFFDIFALGGPSHTDRSFSLQQQMVGGVLNAVAGEDYIPFDDAQLKNMYVIRAGAVHTSTPIVMLRSKHLQDTVVTLKINVVSNENFKVGDSTLVWRKLTFTDELMRPNNWTATVSKYYFGTYSTVKHRFMVEKTGEKWDEEFLAEILKNYSLLTYYRLILKKALIEYNTAHPEHPLKDESGTLVTYP